MYARFTPGFRGNASQRGVRKRIRTSAEQGAQRLDAAGLGWTGHRRTSEPACGDNSAPLHTALHRAGEDNRTFPRTTIRRHDPSGCSGPSCGLPRRAWRLR